MFSSLAKLLQSVQTGSLKNILTGAGVMLGTMGVSMSAFNLAVDRFRTMSGSVGLDLIALMNLSGMDLFFSSILGATATYITLQSGKLFLQKQQ